VKQGRGELRPSTHDTRSWDGSHGRGCSCDENGIRWTAYAAVLGGLKATSRGLQGRMARLEARHGLSGRNSAGVNYEYWQRWDWSRAVRSGRRQRPGSAP